MMRKKDLLFYSEYEEFYSMAGRNEIFHKYCEKVFGRDFSQDGFSDITQIDDIIELVNISQNQVILDIGCGNGKMLKYVHEKTGAITYGFDYSENAIRYANNLVMENKEAFHFETGLIGQIQYKENLFDLITSIDSIYFAEDISAFIKHILNWLKPNGYFVCAYQEGDIKKKSKDKDHSELALIFHEMGIKYEVLDYSKRTYDLLKHKRNVIESMKDEFLLNDLSTWYECAMYQSIDANMSYEKFALDHMMDMMQRKLINIIARKTNANNHGLVIYAVCAIGVHFHGICIVTTMRLQI
jgi:2-polyprenyl-3-methyl-5-hydroxy-6-metoxy-1,4-benzoquinol methylase